jgi:hypothetical protein
MGVSERPLNVRIFAVVVSAVGFFAILVGLWFVALSNDPDMGPIPPAYPVGSFFIATSLIGCGVSVAIKQTGYSRVGAAIGNLFFGAVLGAGVPFAIIGAAS